jgi:hypothetical protein
MMIFAVIRSTLTNLKGEVVARVDHRMMNHARPSQVPSQMAINLKNSLGVLTRIEFAALETPRP